MPFKDTDIVDSPLREAVGSYKKAHPVCDNIDAQFVLNTLEKAEESAAVFVALNPVIEGEWQGDTPKWGIRDVYLSDERKLVLKVRKDKETLCAGKLYEKISKVLEPIAYKHIPVQYEVKEERFDITDMYGHYLFKDKMAGLPFDIVLVRTIEVE